jgi:tRNA threonylcarbamoyladenosine biosynthesis protein TsaB
MVQIQKMLEVNNIKFLDLGALFVCVGPGSFTGVRSSISAARVFNIAHPDLKLAGISAFDVYANALSEDELSDVNVVIIETRRDDFYVQLFDKKLNKMREPEALTRDAIIGELKEFGCNVSLVGDGVERFLAQPSGLCLRTIKMLDNLPIKILAQTGIKALRENKLNYPKPLYLRAPDVSLPK